MWIEVYRLKLETKLRTIQLVSSHTHMQINITGFVHTFLDLNVNYKVVEDWGLINLGIHDSNLQKEISRNRPVTEETLPDLASDMSDQV